MAKSKKVCLYGLEWPSKTDPVAIEIYMIRHGGRFKTKKGVEVGNGLFFHFKRLQELLWPEKIWHKWNTLETECYLNYRVIVEMGPASSGKTHSAATNVLADYFCFPEQTTVLCCSTTKERLEERIWGEIKKHFTAAKRRYPWLPGFLIEGRQRIVTDPKRSNVEGRDFRNGLRGVPAKRGETYVGLGEFAGIKNKRVRLIGDEVHLLPRAFVDSISNLDKNPDFKLVALGNPKDVNDALGVLAEPAPELGGWDSAIDQQPGTRTWPIRRPNGICIRLWGPDSPNYEGKLGVPLISRAAIERDIAFYGTESQWFTMMDEGRMPRGQGSRRVLTRQFCYKFGATQPPNWIDSNVTKIGFLDAAYKGVGGDRCIFGELHLGWEANDTSSQSAPLIPGLAVGKTSLKQVVALVEYMAIPINTATDEEPEDQIVGFVMNQCMKRGIPPQNFFFDAGMRTSLVTAFCRLWSTLVNSIDCGGPPSDEHVSAEIKIPAKDYYSKFITQLWFDVRLAIEAGQVRGLTEEAIEEFSSREWMRVSNNKIEVEPKASVRAKLGRSPDIADAIAIGFYGARKLGFVIRKFEPAVEQALNRANYAELVTQAREFWRIGALSYDV